MGRRARWPHFKPWATIFDPAAAAALSGQLFTEYPARVPGTFEAEGATRWYSETMSGLGLSTEEEAWTEDLPDLGTVELRNVVTTVPGRSEETIVLVAHRDNAGAEQPLGDNASGTAALVELARGYAPQETGPDPLPQRTLVHPLLLMSRWVALPRQLGGPVPQHGDLVGQLVLPGHAQHVRFAVQRSGELPAACIVPQVAT